MGGKRFKVPGVMVKFTILSFREGNQCAISNLAEFQSNLGAEIARLLGANPGVARYTSPEGVPEEIVYPMQDPVGYLRRLFTECLRQGIRYCFILPSNRKWYGDIKRTADTTGLHTTISMRKKDDSVKASVGEITNLLLEFNLKLGGMNWTLHMADFKFLQGKTAMFVGADVIHPPPGAMDGAPSVAAVVASINPTPGQFPGIIALQHHPEGKRGLEMIPTLNMMIVSRLELWAKYNKNTLPEQILYYRDGVSDSQLQAVLDEELSLIKHACKEVYGKVNKQMPLIYVHVTQKRHLVRFYGVEGDKSGPCDPTRNPLPGLIVDQFIVRPDLDDWFSVSHKCLQGTSRPAHHYRIYDEIGDGKNSDDIQQLTHALSYIYGRSVTSISVPAPARFADRLCERAKHYLHEVFFPPVGGQKYQVANHFKGQQSVHANIRDTMYYI
jgi:eukaryotic translation initiation factor 2C